MGLSFPAAAPSFLRWAQNGSGFGGARSLWRPKRAGGRWTNRGEECFKVNYRARALFAPKLQTSGRRLPSVGWRAGRVLRASGGLASSEWHINGLALNGLRSLAGHSVSNVVAGAPEEPATIK